MKLTGWFLAATVFGYACSGFAEEVTVVATQDACRKLVKHKPVKGVAFTPGVDVRGRPIASADLPSADLPNNGGLAAVLPKIYEFPISVNPLKGNSATRFGETRLNLGQIGFDFQTGAVIYNGRPLHGVARRDFVKKCRDLLRN